ncbi:type II toxin-antitoxin system antitoxin SocA domain-containing protein [Spiroplasma culicicola]|uniref:Antitoxin SocA-like Panacea domain-containing protein n=1 Tax=Spiroplasma culicicola AES-1 TaxID=1276246 RepID=W6A8D7_9MOLU|nr:type II toxin-antitoxin system antitoxin SocA domain-containing protein [Spiroplasma culicicola]AHI53211.1 hypothetical protein SCULI_v1c08710 [Spiroplasma culicicola AES-1]
MFFYSIEEYIDFVINKMAKVNLKVKKKVTQIQIQKIIYIIYAYFLIYKKPITKIDFETWKWGPVIYDLWKQQTIFKANNIPLLFQENIDLKYDTYKESIIVEKIVSFMMSLDSWNIVDICHKQTPWRYLYKPNKNILITDQDILKFYANNPNGFFEYLDFVINK